MSRQRSHLLLYVGSLIAAYLLQLMPLPQSIAPFKPYWLALVLLFWALEEPENVGLGTAFMLGLIGDLIHGEILGEQALRLAVMVFIVLRFRARLRFFPMWQQALAVLSLLINDRIVLLMVRTFAGDPLPAPTFWFAPLAGMLVWPWLFLLFDDLRSRLRTHEA